MPEFSQLFGASQSPEVKARLYPQLGVWSPGSYGVAVGPLHPVLGARQALLGYNGWVYKAVSTISADVSGLEVEATTPGGDPVEQHPLLEALARPTPWMGGNWFRQVLQIHLDLAGEFFVHPQIESGQVRALHLLHPDRVYMVPDPTAYLMGYLYQSWSGVSIAFLPEEVIHVKYAHPADPYRGYSPLHGIGWYRDLSASLGAFLYQYMRNDARPSGLLSSEQELQQPESDELRRRWEEIYADYDGKGRIAVLGKGSKYQPITPVLKDLEVSGLDTVSRDQVLATYNLPKFKLGIVEGDGKANAVSASLVYETSCLRPRVALWNEDFFKPLLRLLRLENKLGLTLADPVTRDVEAERVAALDDLRAGAITVREYHQRLGNAEAATAPEVYLLPNNVTVADTLEPPEPVAPVAPAPAVPAQTPDPSATPAAPDAPAPDEATPAERRLQTELRAVFAREYAERRDGRFERRAALERYARLLGEPAAALELVLRIERQLETTPLVEVYEALKSRRGCGALARHPLRGEAGRA